MNFNDYCTRMYLKEKLGWTDKMIKDLLTNIAYKSNGNFYGGGIVKLYKNTDIEKIETTEKYKELKDKINKRRTKETKKNNCIFSSRIWNIICNVLSKCANR